MLIHGIAGSGKSTTAKKIEEFIWNLHEKKEKNTELSTNTCLYFSTFFEKSSFLSSRGNASLR